MSTEASQTLARIRREMASRSSRPEPVEVNRIVPDSGQASGLVEVTG